MAQFINKPSYTTALPGESIVFFGTGSISRRSLEDVASNYDIEAVISVREKNTRPNRRKIATINDWATENKVRSIQVVNKKELIDIFTSKGFTSKIGIVVDFGIVIPQVIIDTFKHGIINSHFSLLPQWRGADPITFSLLSGQEITGVSIMQIDNGLDTGELLAVEKIKVTNNENQESLTNKLVKSSNNLISQVLLDIFNEDAALQPQIGIPTFSAKLTKSDGELDFNKPAQQLEREVRAYTEWPNSYTHIDNERVSVVKAKFMPHIKKLKPGKLMITSDKNLAIACNRSLLIIDQLKPAGKGAMSSVAFLAGRQKLSKSLETLEI